MEQLDVTPIAIEEEGEGQGAGIAATEGRGRWRVAAGCGATLLATLLALLLLVCGGLWWAVATVTESVTVYPTLAPLILDQGGAGIRAVRATATALPIMLAAPTPVIPATNLDGGIRHPDQPSHSWAAPAITDRPLRPYVPYTAWQGWENSTAAKSRYLAGVNLTGQRRTPYTKGQRLQYPDGRQMTIVTGDFDFTLLQDEGGRQWACGPAVNTLQDLQGCFFWR